VSHPPPGFDELSVEEQIDYVQSLWNRIAATIMARRWIVRPLAASDLEHAVSWYEEQKPGLGMRFLDAADQLFDRLRETPLPSSQMSLRERHT
jgi:hypothetical protein